jgi:hypothetical protein
MIEQRPAIEHRQVEAGSTDGEVPDHSGPSARFRRFQKNWPGTGRVAGPIPAATKPGTIEPREQNISCSPWPPKTTLPAHRISQDYFVRDPERNAPARGAPGIADT